jgi:hypothetical protein
MRHRPRLREGVLPPSGGAAGSAELAARLAQRPIAPLKQRRWVSSRSAARAARRRAFSGAAGAEIGLAGYHLPRAMRPLCSRAGDGLSGLGGGGRLRWRNGLTLHLLEPGIKAGPCGRAG